MTSGLYEALTEAEVASSSSAAYQQQKDILLVLAAQIGDNALDARVSRNVKS